MEYWDGLLKTPYYLVDETLLKQNLEILREVSGRAGCKILLAQKAFSMFSVYPLLREYLAGSAASGLFEAYSIFAFRCSFEKENSFSAKKEKRKTFLLL